MKRHPALVELSRDHHHALVIARDLRRATAETADAAAGRFLEHWRREENAHFRVEEEVLLPTYAAYGDPDHPAVARVLVDHVLIRRDAEQVEQAPSLELLHTLGARLADHVKLEENELFPLVESAVPEPELQALGRRLEQAMPEQRR